MLTNGRVVIAESNNEERKDSCEERLSLDTFRAYALNHSPLVAEIDRDYSEALAQAFEIEALQNPELQVERSFTRMKLDGANDPQTEVSISQPLRLSNFGTRSNVSELMKRAGDVQKKLALLELTQKIGLQFKTLYVYQKTKSILEEAETRAGKKVELIREGVRKGLLSRGDEKLFEGEKFRLQAHLKNIEAKVAVVRNDLAKSVGLSCIRDVILSDKLEDVPSLKVLLEKARSSKFSEIAKIEALAALSQEQERLASLDVIPEITPRLIYQHSNDGGDFFGAGFSIPLPFWNQNQSEKLRAGAQNKIIQLKKRFLQDGGIESQITETLNAVLRAQEQAMLFSEKVVPSFEGALVAQEELYSQGKGDVLQVWQTLRAVNEAQAEGLEVWLQAVSVRSELSILVGDEI